MKRLASIVFVLVVASPQWTAGQAEPPQAPRQWDFRERYGILTDRNIFLRNRSRPPVRTATTNPSASASQASRRPEQSYVLRGVVLEEGRRIAFIENVSAGTTLRLAVGASVAGGKIIEVDFHHLEFETAAGTRVKVEVGRTLAGSTEVATGSSTQPSAESSAPIDPNNPNLSALERLRLRRQRSLGQ